MMRRIAAVVHAHRPDAILDVHLSTSLTLPTLAFCDSFWNGEQFESLKASDEFELPLHAFRTEFMGYAHGLDAEFLCYENRPFTLTEAIALAWVHGVEVRPFPSTLPQISPLWRVMDNFGLSLFPMEWLLGFSLRDQALASVLALAVCPFPASGRPIPTQLGDPNQPSLWAPLLLRPCTRASCGPHRSLPGAPP
jgi:hypothetical protein